MLSELLFFYLGSSGASVAFNLYLNHQFHKRNSEAAINKLDYADLSDESLDKLDDINICMENDNKITTLLSMIPIYNIYFSLDYMLTDQYLLDSDYSQIYEEVVNETNKLEREIRGKYLKHLKTLKTKLIIPKEYQDIIECNKLDISETDYKKILKLNSIPYDDSIINKKD